MKPYASLSLLFPILLAFSLPAPVSAQPPSDGPVKITQLFKRSHPEYRNRDVIVQRVELAPGGSAPAHVHPGMVTGYVLSGALEFQLAGEPLRTLRAGDTFFEAPGSKHLVARNLSKRSKAVLIAFVENPKNTPVAQPYKGHAAGADR